MTAENTPHHLTLSAATSKPRMFKLTLSAHVLWCSPGLVLPTGLFVAPLTAVRSSSEVPRPPQPTLFQAF